MKFTIFTRLIFTFNYFRINHQVFGVIITDQLKWTILSVFPFLISSNGMCNLNIGVVHIQASNYKITFHFTFFANIDCIIKRSCVDIHKVLQNRLVMAPVICILYEVETQVCKIVFLFPGHRPP